MCDCESIGDAICCCESIGDAMCVVCMITTVYIMIPMIVGSVVGLLSYYWLLVDFWTCVWWGIGAGLITSCCCFCASIIAGPQTIGGGVGNSIGMTVAYSR